jgi:PEP-CTERM motif
MRSLVLSAAALLVFGVATARADILFYGGDFDPNNPNTSGLANENDAIVSGSPYGAAVYQNFIVPAGQTWNVTGLWSNNLSDLNPATAYYEIRTGVSEGNGGTLIGSGDVPVVQTPTGRSGFGFTEFMDQVAVNFVLGPGTYWMTVVPEDPNGLRSFNSNTFGLNSVGTDIDDQQFFNSGFFGTNFTNADNEGPFSRFSDGVGGTLVQSAVPEPTSLMLLGLGAVSLAGYALRRKKGATKVA